jgi:hypothetical protein
MDFKNWRLRIQTEIVDSWGVRRWLVSTVRHEHADETYVFPIRNGEVDYGEVYGERHSDDDSNEAVRAEHGNVVRLFVHRTTGGQAVDVAESGRE